MHRVDVIKVRMQADRAGTLYRGVGDAFTKIYAHEGLRGFVRVRLRSCALSFVCASDADRRLDSLAVHRACGLTSSAGSS